MREKERGERGRERGERGRRGDNQISMINESRSANHDHDENLLNKVCYLRLNILRYTSDFEESVSIDQVH